MLINFLRFIHRKVHKRREMFDVWKVRYKRELRLRLISRKFSIIQFLRAPIRRRPAFFIGPTNSANQATLWSSALKRYGLNSQSIRISSDTAQEWFTSNLSIARSDWLKFSERQRLADIVASSANIVLFESLRPMFRLNNAKDGRNLILEDFELMELIGKRIGVVFHGSDIRNTQAHAERNPYSPFHNESPELENLRARTAVNSDLIPELRARKIPMFVTTKDLLFELPDAHWLPVTIDFEKFHDVAKRSPIFSDPNKKLRVLFLPSRSWLKSADLIEPVLIKLRDEGVIEYHSYIATGENIQHSKVPEVMSQVDLVIDQYLGVIGVFPIEALAAGRLVMSYVPPDTGEIPIISITPESIESEIRRVAQERPSQTLGPDFARKWHDGNASVRALADVFGFKAKAPNI